MKKSRKVFAKAKRKIKNKIIQDASGDELEFPDIDIDDTPGVGDTILIDGKANLSGQRLLPNTKTLVFVNGVITEVIEPEDEITNLIKSQKDSLKRSIKIMGDDKSMPYLKGNSILVDGKELIMGKVQVGNIQLNIFRGKITKVEKV